MPNFKIIMKWTQKGLDEIDKAPERRGYALKILTLDYPQTAAGPPPVFPIAFRYSGSQAPNLGRPGNTTPIDIEYMVDDKLGHIVWHVVGTQATVQEFANKMAFHQRVNVVVRPDPD
jgi:hypothetical protein